MKVTQGRTVIFRGIDSNGTLEHPAIVTRSWSDRDLEDGAIAVNLTVFLDAAAPRVETSVMLFASREDAIAHQGGMANSKVAWFPEKA